MNKKIFIVLLSSTAVSLFPESLEAIQQGSSKFSASDINDHAKSISDFLFGPVAKIAGVLGGGYGLITSVLSSSVKPLITFGGIGLSVVLVPKFIESVFTMLLP